jgi:hypothetical protein
MVAAAVIGSAVVGVAGSAISAKNNKKAINKSTDASLTAQRESLAAQQKAFDQILPLQQGALNNAVGYQTGAYNSAGQALTSAYNNSTGALNPYMQTGYNANNALNAIVGLPNTGGYQPQQATFTPMAAPAMAPVTSALKTTPTPVSATASLQAYMASPAYQALSAQDRGAARVAFLKGGV